MTDTRIIAVTAATVIAVLRFGPWVFDRIEAIAACIDGPVSV